MIEITSPDGQKYVVAGRLPLVHLNEIITVNVDETKTPLQIEEYKFEIKYTLDSLRRILLQVKGIGKKTADYVISQIMHKHSLDNIVRLEDFIPYLQEIEFPKQEEAIRLIQMYSIADEIGEILGDSVSIKDIVKACASILEDNALDKVRDNYYLLVDYIPDLNLLRLDNYMRQKLSYKLSNPDRIQAFIKNTLNRFARDYRITKIDKSMFYSKLQLWSKVDVKTIKEQVDMNELIYEDDRFVYGLKFKNTEEYVADRLLEIQRETIPIKVDDFIITNMINTHGEKIKNDPIQVEAVKRSFTNKIHIITGGPGTGKSTVLLLIYKIATLLGYNPIVLTPTGKAADRLRDIGARTIHFAIGYDGKRAKKELQNDFVIVDESSMLDLATAYNLLKSVKTPNMVFVGDINQLPPVDAGSVFVDMVRSRRFPVTVLQKIYRQGEGSQIIELANSVLNKNVNKIFEILNTKKDVILLKNVNHVENMIIKLYEKLYTNNPTGNYVVLTPIKSEGIKQSSSNLNNKLRKYNNPTRVICVENDYSRNVYNGQTGHVVNSDDTTITVCFDNSIVSYDFLDYTMYIDYAYTLTIHKAQGSEYDTVILPILYDHSRYWTPKLLYTAITRAKKHLVIISDTNFEKLILNILYSREIVPQSTLLNRLAHLETVEVSV